MAPEDKVVQHIYSSFMFKSPLTLTSIACCWIEIRLLGLVMWWSHTEANGKPNRQRIEDNFSRNNMAEMCQGIQHIVNHAPNLAAVPGEKLNLFFARFEVEPLEAAVLPLSSHSGPLPLCGGAQAEVHTEGCESEEDWIVASLLRC
ncbi:hypothetical protein JRQ81_017251 [Phrynocephalus forsythii]|uniref:Uncharacterized protein n=1 Tax=Phrynocephalus forsythii TaxID=171643 RepID=A0A9Q0XQ09_9SAUR|nr:hypothetical protein JRQ81_017251 [Phrynocephalus forsythii]